MPALLKLALIVAVILLVVGVAVKAVQFLLSVGFVLLVGAGIVYVVRRSSLTR